MFKYFVPILLLACGPYRMLKKDYITLSESPCIDGTILNIDQAGCESFYWGTNPDGIILKIRCTYAPEQNFWTERDFYAVSISYPEERISTWGSWGTYCEDKYVKMYAIPRGEKLLNE